MCIDSYCKTVRTVLNSIMDIYSCLIYSYCNVRILILVPHTTLGILVYDYKHAVGAGWDSSFSHGGLTHTLMAWVRLNLYTHNF